MIVEQLYTSCLSEAAYFIADNGEAAVVDPLRDVNVYIEKAAALNVRIKYIFETHLHADFVSGHLELAEKTGATIIYGPDAKLNFSAYLAKDKEVFEVGKITIEALHTPGHTLESTCFLLKDEDMIDYCVFTGDTLFVGDVGRPDLFSGNMTKEELAGMLYDSLSEKIKSLSDHVIVYPAHGPGSACGKNLGKETFSTIGEQKQTNYALKEQTKEDFVKELTTGLVAPPVYFPINAKLNAQGSDSLDKVKKTALTPLSIDAFKTMKKEGAWILDTRNSTVFTEGFVPSSINVGLEGRFAEWVGSIIPYDKPLILVTEKGQEEESVIRLARVGLDNVKGYLEAGFEGWKQSRESIDMIIDVTADELAMDLNYDNKIQIIDVRKQGEFDSGHIEEAQLIPLNELLNPIHMSAVDENANIYVHCAGGYRSVIACSILKKEGFHNLRNVLGGWSKLKEIDSLPIMVATK